ncbi:MAG: phosphoglycerate mutase family protein, partial [Patescibacteria group bacterium]
MSFESDKQKESIAKAEFHLHIHIARHGEKAIAEDVTQGADEVAPLTPKGRHQALNRGKELQMQGARTMGSPRLRSRETALLITHAHDENVTGEETFEELL